MKNQNNQTRMKKYAALRLEVEQEIKILKLQKDNFIKIQKYKNKLNKIDSHLFEKSYKESLEIFPSLSSLIFLERKNERIDLLKIKEQMSIYNNKIQKKIPQSAIPKLSQFVPSLENEEFIKQQIEANNIGEIELIEIYKRESEKKRNILKKSQNVNTAEFTQIQVAKEANENNSYLKNKLRKIEELMNAKKKKTIWIFWLLLFVLVVLIGCLFVILLLKN